MHKITITLWLASISAESITLFFCSSCRRLSSGPQFQLNELYYFLFKRLAKFSGCLNDICHCKDVIMLPLLQGKL